VSHEPFQNGICLALTQMPDVTQLDSETLVQVIAVARTRDQESEECKFW
jgi:hypothetical protein